MFGFGKKEVAAREAEEYIRTAVAGLPSFRNEAFGDAYVLGFLQVLFLHATRSVDKGPAAAMEVMAKTMDSIVPGYGQQIVQGLVSIAHPSHQFHDHYATGRREGNEYVVALVSNDTLIRDARLQGFRSFVVRNYGN